MPGGQGSGRPPGAEAVGVRRAVTLAAVAGDPGEGVRPEGAGRAAPSQAAGVPERETRRPEGRTAPGPEAEPGADAARVPGEGGGSAAPGTAAAEGEGEAEPIAVAAPRGDGPPGGEDGLSAPGRPRKPLLAAAALAGAVLLAVPLVLAGRGDDAGKDTGEAAAGTSRDLLADGGREPRSEVGTFVAEDPRERADASASPSRSPEAAERKKDVGRKEDVGRKSAPATEARSEGRGGAGDGSGASAATDATGEPVGRETSSAPRREQSAGTGTKREETAAAPRWETGVHALTNAYTGKCLAKADSSREVTQGACGDAATWQRYAAGGGVVLLKNPASGQCLDSNGEDLYVSPCTTEDEGQLWRMSSAGGCEVSVVSDRYDEYVTGWKAGNATLAGSAAIDKADKRDWKAPSMAGNC